MYNRRLVFAAACLGMLVFGIVLTALGSVLPSLIARFGLDNAAAGVLLALMSLGILAGSLVFGPIVDRYGYKELLTACMVLILAGVEGLAFAPSRMLLVPAILLTGFAGGVVSGSVQALVADIGDTGKGARIALIGVFFGIGALTVPLLLGLLLSVVSYSTVMAVIGALIVLPALYCAAIRFPKPKQPQGVTFAGALRLLRDPTLLLLGLMLFLESGVELTAGGWTATYAQEALGLPADQSLFFLSLYWAGLTAMRLVLGWLLTHAAPAPVLYTSLATALAAALLVIAATSPVALAIGCTVLGIGFAAVFPTVLGLVGERYAALSGTAFGLVIAIALAGGTTLPWLTGVLSDKVGLRAAFGVIPAGLIASALVFLAARKGLVRGNG
jgi:fucose permease